MDVVLLIVAAMAASEAMLRLPLVGTAQSLAEISVKSSRLLRSRRISDHWKERVLPAYSLRMAKSAIGFAALLMLSLLPVMIIGFVHAGGVQDWMAVLMRPLSVVILCAASIVYLMLRLRLKRVRLLRH